MKLLEIVRALNSGILLWQTVGPLVQLAMENGQDEVPLDDVRSAQAMAGLALDGLDEAIARAQAEGR